MTEAFVPLRRAYSPGLDAILGKSFKILDKGFIRVIDYMGNDESIVEAARNSYGKGTKKVSSSEDLIRYLMRKRHTTPVEMNEIKLQISVPMDCWRQWIRHRTATVNEYSTRYSEALDDMAETMPGEWRLQAENNKQGSDGHLFQTDPTVAVTLSGAEKGFHAQARHVYQQRLNVGIAREQARKDLPLSTYTRAFWKIDLHNLLHFLSLRMPDEAQKEIRDPAHVICHQILKAWVPTVYHAFLDYRLNAMTLSAMDIKMMREIIQCQGDASQMSVKLLAQSFNWFSALLEPKRRCRELKEFEAKARRLGVQLPWNS